MTFEQLLEIAKALPVPEQDNQRMVEWCGAAKVLGLARERGGGHELFVRGSRLSAASWIVGHHLKHGGWSRPDGVDFEANRIVLPPEHHFLAVAAFIAEELLRNGVDADRDSAFKATEPVIEMALRGAALPEETILGLLGELSFLRRLLGASSSANERASCIAAWKGHERKARDFEFQGEGRVEVKVTRASRSSHHISGLAQVDPKRTPGGLPLERLFLLSIGVRQAGSEPSTDALTLPSLVGDVLQALGPRTDPSGRNEIQNLFLKMVESYGDDSSAGYRHDAMRGWAVYQEPWELRFERVYDMNDDGMRVLRLADVERQHFVSSETVHFVVELPEQVDGDNNPLTNLAAFASDLLSQRR